MNEGLYKDISAAAYHADPCPEPSLSSSTAAKLVTESPAHVRFSNHRLNPDALRYEEDNAAFALGSVVHELALGRGSGFSIFEGETWRGTAAQEFKATALAEGKIPIKRTDFQRATLVVKNVREQLAAFQLGYVLEEGDSEVVGIWKDRGHYMRAMFDRWLPERGEIWDIKTTARGAHPEKIAQTITRLNYDLRSEFYLLGAEKLTGKPSSHALGFCFLFVEVEPPFAVTPCYMDASLKARGRMRANEAIDTWVRCMETGIWPSYTDKVVEITAPGWVDFELEETGITSSGEQII